MGRSLSTKIVYGYDIGGREDGWNFEEYDDREYRMKWPEWVVTDDPDADPDDDPDDFVSQAQDRLLAELTDFKEIPWDQPRPDDYYSKKNAAEKALGIEFEIYGVSDYTQWVIGFELARESDGIGEIDSALIAAMLNPLNMADMDYRLGQALRVLQLHPRGQLAPRLLLLASYF